MVAGKHIRQNEHTCTCSLEIFVDYFFNITGLVSNMRLILKWLYLCHYRRTGKDIVAGKQIRRDEDGLEIFDDYLSPSSGRKKF